MHQVCDLLNPFLKHKKTSSLQLYICKKIIADILLLQGEEMQENGKQISLFVSCDDVEAAVSRRQVTLILVSTLSSVKRVFMSIRACRVSLYTVPRKLSGRESWKRRPLTITRSPTVIVPAPHTATHTVTPSAAPSLSHFPSVQGHVAEATADKQILLLSYGKQCALKSECKSAYCDLLFGIGGILYQPFVPFFPHSLCFVSIFPFQPLFLFPSVTADTNHQTRGSYLCAGNWKFAPLDPFFITFFWNSKNLAEYSDHICPLLRAVLISVVCCFL